jgi:hypothetical protein
MVPLRVLNATGGTAMSGERDDTLLIADWQGRLYRVPRAVLEQYEVEPSEAGATQHVDAQASPLLGAAIEQAEAERARQRPADDARRER